ncbi:MAG: helix-turn-helix domain-containing GNAT family N-acetyltransferase [Acidobacteriales bacterium]|nr:helix-turn-helix domain-containing GNAT family N-acetyltransferase [Terriglobales bacterium]
MAEASLASRVEAVRHFNRFYTRQIGVLQEGLLRSPFSLTEVRVLYELANREKPTATALRRELGLDAGYLSRMLRNFEKSGLLRRRSSESDARAQLLELTGKGRNTFAGLNRRAEQEIRAMLRTLPAAGQHRLLGAMSTVETVLDGSSKNSHPQQEPYRLRPHQPGDMGWVVYRHGALYAEEYGYNHHFEALVAKIAGDFLENFDPKRERCWIAERNGEMVGSVFLVKKSGTVAKLRMLLVEPSARGLGLGGRLIDECVRFAREAGYKKITLWTQSELHAARRLYKRAGFQLTGRKRHSDFGRPSAAEVWDLKL